MSFLLLSFVVSLIATLLVVRSSDRHGHLSADHELDGPQKFHRRPVPRVGGVGVMIAMLSGALLAQLMNSPLSASIWLFLACALPAFGAGLAEDLTKKVSPAKRLWATAASAALGAWCLDALIRRTDIPGVDLLVSMPIGAIALTLLVVSGVANAVNIIDGFNGLAAMCALIMLLALAYVGLQLNDRLVVTVALIAAGATLGFFVWNFPAGLIFLGDGGAYLLGFAIAELGVLTIARHPTVSPLFPLLLCAYPIFETIFSIYRKKYLRHMSPGLPDGVHLHMLVHRRLIRPLIGEAPESSLRARNSMTSPYLWLLCSLSVIPAMLWFSSTAVLAVFIVLFMVSYTALYWSIVRFKVPRWAVVRH
jgi:UDP-N-acetylmuramyl pentapeptide phosphotransferase/UDP-N-acetylglucosamine-1-phosphate transferase